MEQLTLEEDTEAVNIGGCLSNITNFFIPRTRRDAQGWCMLRHFPAREGESRSGWQPMKGLKVKTANSKAFGADTVSIMILHTNWHTIPNLCIVCLQNT